MLKNNEETILAATSKRIDIKRTTFVCVSTDN